MQTDILVCFMHINTYKTMYFTLHVYDLSSTSGGAEDDGGVTTQMVARQPGCFLRERS